jgi:hypothetical protein
MILYHDTDVASALDILNQGLDATTWLALQRGRRTQLGVGWYAACDAEVAWFFASLAPGNTGRGYTVIELEVPEDLLNQLVAAGQAIRMTIANVPFVAQQYWFALEAFDLLNARATFRPSRGQEPSYG